MRSAGFALLLVSTACASKPTPLTEDTPRTTTSGNPFVAPSGWTVTVKGPATIMAPPEPDSAIALVDVKAADADAALALAWAAFREEEHWKLRVATASPDSEGWTQARSYQYEIPPNAHRVVSAWVGTSSEGAWTAVIWDMQQDVAQKREGQTDVIIDHLVPKGYVRETFAGKKAQELDAARIAELSKFVATGLRLAGVPGAAIGLVQDGKVVFVGGFGEKELGKGEKPDGDTLFRIASNTKPMTTLLLARLVDAKKLDWDTHVTALLPGFQLGSPETTARVLVRHLICACTGMPRQDYEWVFESKTLTPEKVLGALAHMQPTSDFGKLYQYSNPMAAAAGFTAGHVAFPDLELGAAYDKAMQTLVFDPLGMTRTTFEPAKAMATDHATGYGFDTSFRPRPASPAWGLAFIPLRPAGGAWSSVNDVLRYVQMEIDEGVVDGKPFVSKEALLARRRPQVAVGNDESYGMGLRIVTGSGVTLIDHGGDLPGFHSDMMWLPEHKVGAVVLTNGDAGWLIAGGFQRKLLEVLFDGRPEADARLAARAESMKAGIAAQVKLTTIPADPALAATLAGRYLNDALGTLTVEKDGPDTVFDAGEWKTAVGSRKNEDGTASFITLEPGLLGVTFTAGEANGKRTLTLRDGQHAYVFTEAS